CIIYGLYLYLSRCRCKRMPLVAPSGRQTGGWVMSRVQLRRTAHILRPFLGPTMNW
ncbi:hypothetical protein BDZ91DRAFT_732651, partial [Kalaharituber pfeilii]